MEKKNLRMLLFVQLCHLMRQIQQIVKKAMQKQQRMFLDLKFNPKTIKLNERTLQPKIFLMRKHSTPEIYHEPKFKYKSQEIIDQAGFKSLNQQQALNQRQKQLQVLVGKFKIFYQLTMEKLLSSKYKKEQMPKIWQQFQGCLQHPLQFDKFILSLRQKGGQKNQSSIQASKIIGKGFRKEFQSAKHKKTEDTQIKQLRRYNSTQKHKAQRQNDKTKLKLRKNIKIINNTMILGQNFMKR